MPPSSTEPILDLVGSEDKDFHMFDVGHVGIYISPQSKIPSHRSSETGLRRGAEMAKDFVTYDEIEIGAKASFSKTIRESDVYQFAGITGDFNERISIRWRRSLLFRSRVVHGCLADSLVSTGNEISGEGNDIL